MGTAYREPRSPRTVAALVTGPRKVWLKRCQPLPVAAVAAAKLRAGCLLLEYLCSPESPPTMVPFWPRLDRQIAPLALPPPRAPLLGRSCFCARVAAPRTQDRSILCIMQNPKGRARRFQNQNPKHLHNKTISPFFCQQNWPNKLSDVHTRAHTSPTCYRDKYVLLLSQARRPPFCRTSRVINTENFLGNSRT